MSDNNSDNTVKTTVMEGQSKKEQLLKNTARVLSGFGVALIVGMAVVYANYHSARTDIVVMGGILGAFMVTLAVVIKYSLGLTPKTLLPAKIDASWCGFRIASGEEILACLPRAYLITSGLILLTCSGFTIAGDVILSGPKYVSILCGISLVYITSAVLGIILALRRKEKHLKVMIACYVLANGFGCFLAHCYTYGIAPELGYSFPEMLKSMGKIMEANGMAVGQDYRPIRDLGVYYAMKSATADVVYAFTLFNSVLATTFVIVHNNNGIFIRNNDKTSPLLGMLGILLVISSIVVNISMYLMVTGVTLTTHTNNDLIITRHLSAILGLLTGLLASLGFYSAGNLHKFTTFALSFSTVVLAVMTIMPICEFQVSASASEVAAKAPCQNISDASNLFCVYNTTGSYGDYSKDTDGIIYYQPKKRRYDPMNPQPVIKEKEPVKLACIPEEKRCDGKADLFEHTNKDYRCKNRYFVDLYVMFYSSTLFLLKNLLQAQILWSPPGQGFLVQVQGGLLQSDPHG